jgi:hypothetical protein
MKTKRAMQDYQCWECKSPITKGTQYARRSVRHGEMGISYDGKAPQSWKPYRVAEPICTKCAGVTT